MPRISADEYRNRLECLRAEVAGADLDLFLVSSFDSIYYLTGAGFEPLERPFFMLVPAPGVGEPALLVPRLDAEHMKKAQSVQDIHTYWEYPAPVGRRWSDVLCELIGKSRRVGVEPSLKCDVAEGLRALSPVVAPLVERQRLVKSPGEVAMIRRAAHYADRAVGQLLAASYCGATVAEGFARTGTVTRAIIREVEGWEFLTTRVLMATWAAPWSAQPHSVPGLADRLGAGPHVALAFLRVNGYAAESERTYFTARPTREMEQAFRAMEEARNLAFRMIRPGVACGAIDAAVGAYLKREGYAGEECRLHRTGHGIGLGNHEAPWVAEGSDDVLAENMVISVEPGIYLHGDGAGGFRHSDTVLVTHEGCEILTRLPTDIGSLTLRCWKPFARVRGALVRRALRPKTTESGVDRHDGSAQLDANVPQSRHRPARLARRIRTIGGLISVVAGVLFVLGWLVARQSLPMINGEMVVRGPKTMIYIDRDDRGIPTVRAADREDLAFGLGFVHGQDRFFQMDGLRRYAAGELSEIFGPGSKEECVAWDRQIRVQRFRSVARQVVAALGDSERHQLDAYVAGVRSGLGSLKARPFEYLLLQETPRPWVAEDSVLVILSLFIDLQGDNIAKESTRGVLHDVLPGPLAEFLSPRGSVEWDAPMFGGPILPPPVPGPDVFDLRNEPAGTPDPTPWDVLEDYVAGSNNWALAGSRTADSRAWVANDMHLHLRVPNIWYRACLEWPDEKGTARRRAVGVTVPGGPGIVVGSNGRIAWGFTNTQGDWSDLIILEIPPGKPDHYLTPDGLEQFETQQEIIRVKGRPDEALTVESTIWGPVIGADHRGRKRVLRWVAGDPGGVDLRLLDVSLARSLEEGLERANRCGSPHQNIVIADNGGRIGWTILGRIPRRIGFDGRLPESWADGSKRWDGYLPPSKSPRLIDPPSGQLWSANARVCSGDDLVKVGDGGYDRGARAKQIRDRLSQLKKATPGDLLALQLDDRALFLERWRLLLLDVLTPEAVARNARRRALRRHVEGWSGKASVDSVGYRMVWEFRLRTVQAVLSPLTTRCRAADPEFRLRNLHTLEEPAWALVSRRPPHLLDQAYPSWERLLRSVVDAMLGSESADGSSLKEKTWGLSNTGAIKHPLSPSIPWLSRWLDMPADPLPGGRSDMPRIQGPDFGASQRSVVSPGCEERSTFHMPCGQSGHPLSPFYRKGHNDWVHGHATPLLPGQSVATLVLEPER